MRDIYIDDQGVARFEGNSLVRYLLEAGGIDLVQLSYLPGIPEREWEELAQLIGYSVCGFCDLPYVSDRSAEIAKTAVESLLAMKK